MPENSSEVGMARRDDERAEQAYQKALRRIDREWQEERAQYLQRCKDGSFKEPQILPCQIAVVVIPVALLFFFFVFFDKHDFVWLIPFGFVAFILSIVWGATLKALKDAIALEKARKIYEVKRRNLRVEDFQAK
jgi:hypothetical protein